MLKARLFSGLATLVIVLVAVGLAGILLIRSASREFDERLRLNYTAIGAAQSFRVTTSTLNNHYLPPLIDPEPTPTPPRATFEATRPKLEDALATLNRMAEARANRDPEGGKRVAEAVARLRPAVDEYVIAFETMFDEWPDTRENRAAALAHLSALSLRITDLSQAALSIFEADLFQSAMDITNRARDSVFFIVGLMAVGIAIAVLIFFQLVRSVVDPVVGLTESIKEIRRGNFELSLQPPRSRTELSELIPAFNEMAAELRVRRRQMDDRLMETNMQNRAILAAIPSPLFMLDSNGGVTQINPAAETLLGQLHLPDRLPAKIQKRFEGCRASGQDYLPQDPRDAVLFRIDETEVFFLPRVFRFATPDRVREGWAVLLVDVTRFRWLDDMKTNLLSTVSHEIKTPLTGIRMVLHLLLEQKTGALTEMQQTMLESANEDCERLLATLNRLLELARVESGAVRIQKRLCDLSDSVERTLQLFEAAANEKKISLRSDIEPNLPKVMIDPVMIDEVLNNLISNAIKHSPEGEKISLRVVRLDADFLRVSVIDKGAGVPEASQTRIFDKFYRAPGQHVDGVGLGLAIAREIMTAHEGRIGLKERTREETEFYIDVPID